MVCWGVRRKKQKDEKQATEKESLQNPTNCSQSSWGAGRERGVSFGRYHCCWELTVCETGCGGSPTPILCVCMCAYLCVRDREWDMERVWLFNLPLPHQVLVCISVCACTLPTPNLSAFIGSQIKWSELAINAVLSRPVGSKQACCVAPTSPVAWED